MVVYDEYSWDKLTTIKHKTLEEYGGSIPTSWGTIIDEDGIMIYEGFLWNEKPYGPGTEYYKNGRAFREGLWDIKGIIAGREYYENGRLRFEGMWRIHAAYGPNPPICGSLFAEDGNLIYSGEFMLTHGGVGYPSVVKPVEYGKNVPSSIPVVGFDDFKR